MVWILGKLLASFAVAMALGGCATQYQLPPNLPNAEFVVSSLSDSTGTVARNLQAQAIDVDGAKCKRSKYGHLLGDIYNPAGTELLPVRVAAGEEFYFVLIYVEGRVMEGRQCMVMAGFKPAAAHRYKAVLVTKGGVAQCGLGVYDITGGQEQRVDFSMPEMACGWENGRPTWTIYEFKTIP